MATARQRAEWGRTAELLAMMHNAVPGMKASDMKTAKDFNPYEVAPKIEPLEVPISALKIFCQQAALARPGDREL